MMKALRYTLVLFLVLSAVVRLQAQQIFYQFANEQTVMIGGNPWFQFDVMLHCAVSNTFHSRGQVYINYNPLAFGNSVVSGGRFQFQMGTLLTQTPDPPFDFLGPKYMIVNNNAVDNSDSRFSITWQSNFLAFTAGPTWYTEVPVGSTQLLRFRLRISDASVPAGISFEQSLMNNQTFLRNTLPAPAPPELSYSAPYFYLNTLPVTLKGLNAEVIRDRYIQVNWITENERNNRGFWVERSVDGVMFETLGWVEGAGNSADERYYRFDDFSALPEQRYLYRLKQEDLNGATTLSDMVEAGIGEVSGLRSTASVYPNPMQGSGTLRLNARAMGVAELQLFDLLGRQVQAFSQQVYSDLNYITLDLAKLPVGRYMLRIRLGEEALAPVWVDLR